MFMSQKAVFSRFAPPPHPHRPLNQGGFNFSHDCFFQDPETFAPSRTKIHALVLRMKVTDRSFVASDYATPNSRARERSLQSSLTLRALRHYRHPIMQLNPRQNESQTSD